MVLRLKFYAFMMRVLLPTGKELLSGDDRAVFERVLHGKLREKGSGFKVSR